MALINLLSDSDKRILERSSATYTVDLHDEDGEAVALSAITALTLTLYDTYTRRIVNDREAVNVLTNGDFTVTDGLLTWRMQPADNPIIRDKGPGKAETHVALFALTYTTDDGSRTVRYEEEFAVYNLHGVS